MPKVLSQPSTSASEMFSCGIVLDLLRELVVNQSHTLPYWRNAGIRPPAGVVQACVVGAEADILSCVPRLS
jgi:hypothetical protein